MAGFWESCLLRFEQELPAQQFNTWIKPLRLEGESVPLDGLRLIAPNSFILKWVRDRYLTRIEEYAGAAFLPGRSALPCHRQRKTRPSD
jgi:chromosomal replication initiator protein